MNRFRERNRSFASAFCAVGMLIVIQNTKAGTFTESFATHPVANGWQVFGTNNLFVWDSTNQNLRVTWDSSKPNNCFHRALGTILTPADDFSLSFDLRFEDYTSGVNPAKPGTFQASIGLLNLDQATRTNFFRGAGTSTTYGPMNIVEFDFFPSFDTFNPTIAQTVVGTNSSFSNWRYNHDVQLEMMPGENFRITMNYSSATRTLTTTLTNNGSQYGSSQLIVIPSSLEFRVTTLAVSSFSDAIQPPIPGSILAHGVVDNVVLTTPPPPVENVAGGFAGANWRVELMGRTNWIYTLERTTHFAGWTNISAATSGNGTTLTLTDSNPPIAGAFYRVRANRP